MASYSQDTYIVDAYLHAILSNYDKLFRQLHLFNFAQKQLRQAICDDASEADLRAHLDSTLLNITDGANEEREDFAEFTSEDRKNGKARLGPESPDLLAREGYWALHWAARKGHAEMVNAILLNKDVNVGVLMSVDKSLIEDRLSCGFDTSFDWFDGSDIGPFYEVSFTPLQLASLYADIPVLELLKGRIEATIEYDTGVEALQIARKMRRDEIVKILMDMPEVEKDVKGLYRDRQAHVDAANAILVGAALIASVAFAGWLTPPLGYSPFFGSASLDAGAPTPSGMYPSFVSVEGHPSIKLFWMFNSLSFFFAISALVVRATAARPLKKDTTIRKAVLSLRREVDGAYIYLIYSVLCAVGAFVIAGFVVLPPIPSYTTVMMVTVFMGSIFVIFEIQKNIILLSGWANLWDNLLRRIVKQFVNFPWNGSGALESL
ncbi:unnamed protein product [Sphagnum jensenii]|uniref:PGG domain-containing protein n=1 Tax=Sphagnum jensenii TaxID=128206 RepID=A0ABP1BA68_9BRYO